MHSFLEALHFKKLDFFLPCVFLRACSILVCSRQRSSLLVPVFSELSYLVPETSDGRLLGEFCLPKRLQVILPHHKNLGS